MYIPSQPQFIKRDWLNSTAVVMAWIFGVIVPIFISTFGNYVAFVGGWGNVSTAIVGRALLVAVVWQAVCCICQFAFKARGWWVAYGVALLVSVAPTFVGYYQPVYDYLSPFLSQYLDRGVMPLIMLFTGVSALLLDVLPEWVAVEG
jgi:hypothetical protein